MNNQPISLGELIDLLAARPQDQSVYFDFCDTVPYDVDSYRGYYDHLALNWRDVEAGYMLVGDLLAILRKADGEVFEGYKGGDFRMDRDTPMWVANYGRSHSTAVIGLAECGYSTVIATGYCDEWEGGMARALKIIFEGLGFGNV